jgi:hypothetical protein
VAETVRINADCVLLAPGSTGILPNSGTGAGCG